MEVVQPDICMAVSMKQRFPVKNYTVFPVLPHVPVYNGNRYAGRGTGKPDSILKQAGIRTVSA
ncbi:hypothetical protein AB6G07_10190 [Providencia stuartii]|uniref:hypothetical protein n=1 Tax=Providencia stuartii TaxID=588 RepID=UPI0034DD6526